MSCLVPGCRMPENGKDPAHDKRFHVVPGCNTRGCAHPLDGLDLYTHYGNHHQQRIELEEGVRVERAGKLFHCPSCAFARANPKEMREHWVACEGREEGTSASQTNGKRASVGGESPNKRTRDEFMAAVRSSVGSASTASSKAVRPVYSPWTKDEENTLRRLVLASRGNPNWNEIERAVGRTRCMVRWESLRGSADHQNIQENEPERERSITNGQFIKQRPALPSASFPQRLALSGGFTPSGKARANQEQQQRLRGEPSTSSSAIKLAPVYSPWTTAQEVHLLAQAKKYTDKGLKPNWREIEQVVGRTKCQRRWKQLIEKGLSAQPESHRTTEGETHTSKRAWHRRWSKAEESLLMKLVDGSSDPDWEDIGKTIGRTASAVETRYQNLVTDGKRGGERDRSDSDSEHSSSDSDSESAPSHANPPVSALPRAPAVSLKVDPETAAHNAMFEALERETAAKISRAIQLETLVHRMRQARAVAADADRRLAAAMAAGIESEGLGGGGTPSLTAIVEPRHDSRPAPPRDENALRPFFPPVVPERSDQRMAATPDEDVKFQPSHLARSPSSLAFPTNGLIFLGSDSSEDDEDDEDDD